VMLYANTHSDGDLPEHLANVGFVVRAYSAIIDGVETTTPTINLFRTNNGGWSQMSFELGVPTHEGSRVVPAGSTVSATVEYVVPPSDAAAYYGASDYLLETPAETYQSAEMMRLLAAGNSLSVVTTVGEVLRTAPVELSAAPGATAVRFTLTGGLGYTPLTFHGLARPDGWRLEILVDDTWQRVTQAVEGNDYWQAYEDTSTGTFDLVFNVHNRGAHEYRLIR
jgi:hypothetical protein